MTELPISWPLDRIGHLIGHLAIGITDCLCQSGNRENKPNRAFILPCPGCLFSVCLEYISSMSRVFIFSMSRVLSLACLECIFVACIECIFQHVECVVLVPRRGLRPLAGASRPRGSLREPAAIGQTRPIGITDCPIGNRFYPVARIECFGRISTSTGLQELSIVLCESFP